MARVVLWLVVACALCKAFTGQWPWQLAGWELRPPRRRSPDEDAHDAWARALLGVAPHAARSEIIEAHKRLVAQVHPDRGGTNDQVHEANAARDRLLRRLNDTQGDTRE